MINLLFVLFILGIAVIVFYAKAFYRWGGERAFESHLLGGAAGILTPWIILAPLHEAGIPNPDSTKGMTVAGLLYALYLALLAIQMRRRKK